MKDLPYFALKQECTKAGLSAKGNKETLLQRLEGVELTSPEPEIKASVILSPTQDELNKFLPSAVFVPKIDTSKYAAWLTSERLQELENRLAPLAAGKGKFNFSINHKGGAYQVEFFGGASGDESTTLIDTDNQIVRRAQQYFNARLVVGTDGQQSVF